MTPEQLKALKDTLGITEDLTAENAADLIGKKVKEICDSNASLQAQVDELKTKQASITPPAVDPELIEDRAEAADEQIDGLVAKGKILPAVAKELKLALVGEKSKRFSLGLSAKLSGTDESLVKKVIKALALNDAVQLSELTKSQGKALSNKNEDDNPVAADVERRRKEAGM